MTKHMGSNFPSTLLTIGGVGLAVHYEQLCTLYDRVPLILAWLKPVSGKTTAAKTAKALIGQHEEVGGMLKTSMYWSAKSMINLKDSMSRQCLQIAKFCQTEQQ